MIGLDVVCPLSRMGDFLEISKVYFLVFLVPLISDGQNLTGQGACMYPVLTIIATFRIA